MKRKPLGGASGVSPVIAIIIMVAIVVILSSILYVWILQMAETDEVYETFPRIEITFWDAPDNDSMVIKHKSGSDIHWADYMIRIINNTNETQFTTLVGLTVGDVSYGQETVFNAENTDGFDIINYESYSFYTVEIYNIADQNRVFHEPSAVCKKVGG